MCTYTCAHQHTCTRPYTHMCTPTHMRTRPPPPHTHTHTHTHTQCLCTEDTSTRLTVCCYVKVVGDYLLIDCNILYVILILLGCKVPKKIDSLQGKGVIKLLCGSQFSIALTNQGHLYTWCVYMCLSVCMYMRACVCVCMCACDTVNQLPFS